MDFFEPRDFWLVLIAVAGIAFVLGRAARGREGGEDRAARRLREEALAAERLSMLSGERQSEIDQLVMDGKTIEAIKLMREETGLGLKESKDAVDARRRALKG